MPRKKKEGKTTITTPQDQGFLIDEIEREELDNELPDDVAIPAAPKEKSREEPGARRQSSTEALDPTQIYLKEIGFSPLLSAEEEVYFGRLSLKGDPNARRRMI